MLVCAYVRVLQDILGLSVIAQNCPSCPVQALVVAAHYDLVKGGFAFQNPPDDLFV
jgi:hypothetical protein